MPTELTLLLRSCLDTTTAQLADEFRTSRSTRSSSRRWRRLAWTSAPSSPKPLTDAGIRAADVVVTLGCGDACPVYPGEQYQGWPVDDSAGQPLEVVRRIRYELYQHLWELIETLVPSVNLLDLQRPTGGKS